MVGIRITACNPSRGRLSLKFARSSLRPQPESKPVAYCAVSWRSPTHNDSQHDGADRMKGMRTVVSLLIALTAGCETAASQSLVPDPAAEIPGPIGGGGAAFRMQSTSLGESRSILVGLPRSFATTAAGRTYPVIIVFDGEGNFRSSMTVVSELASLGHIPESIVVGIPNTNRLRDLTPPGLSVSGSSKSEGGDRFLDFLE